MSDQRLSDLLSPAALNLLSGGGRETVRQIGWDVVRGVVHDVMVGVNLRNSTEALTRRRIAYLNLALIEMFVRGRAANPEFPANLPAVAADILSRRGVKKAERRLAEWLLGLTGKAVQNVLRDDVTNLRQHREGYVETCREVIATYTATGGTLGGQLTLGPDARAEVDWLALLYMANTIGSQTLSVRGSEKSAYGKLFEKLILGSLLTILGFSRVLDPTEAGENVFWLSSTGAKRESDATLLHTKGQGVRFDIGFIGRGNSEISLDKVSRFEKEIQHGRETWFLATVIIIERYGKKSRVVELARAIGGSIIQMSSSVWPQQVAQILQTAIPGYTHPLASMSQSNALAYLGHELKSVSLDSFISTRPKSKRPRRGNQEGHPPS